MKTYKVGIDVGGTFTDLFVYEENGASMLTHKLSSTPRSPHVAPVRGLREVLDKVGARGEQVSFVGLGTTVATNALLEWKGARTGLITTRGFRDLLEIGRQKRPQVYDPFIRKSPVPVPRELRHEVRERIRSDGSVAEPLDTEALRACLDALRADEVASVAICFLNSYANPAHEADAARLCREWWPQAHIVASHEVMPEFREYERFVSTTLNAALMPSTRSYFDEFKHAIAALGIEATPFIMSSSGGVYTPEMAGERPIDMLFSGPSGGVSSAIHLGRQTGRGDMITFDMGGTSTEVCMIRDYRAQMTHQRMIKGYPIRVTSHDIHTIGAGGSSIASVDPGGMLSVGPASAGADPGPACYGTGGTHPTVTDANVVLGRLHPEYLLNGALKIDAARSAAAIEHDVAGPKGIPLQAAAAAIVGLAEANMVQALRVVSVERGVDPADFTLIALGGAGPLHAALVAREAGMARVLVPRDAGVFCAMGVLTKDIQAHHSRTRLVTERDPRAVATLRDVFEALEQAGRDSLGASLADAGQVTHERQADVRYAGQNHEITVLVPAGTLDIEAIAECKERFHQAHEELYGYRFADNTIEFVTLRVATTLPVQRPRFEPAPAAASHAPRPLGQREVLFEGEASVPCPLYDRTGLVAGQVIEGPAIIEQMDSTTLVPPGFTARVDAWQNLEITWQ